MPKGNRGGHNNGGGAVGGGALMQVVSGVDDAINASKTIKQGREALNSGLVTINKAQERNLINNSAADAARDHIRDTFDKKFVSKRATGKGRSEADVTSSTYTRAQNALKKRVDAWFGNR